ncbi:MAG: hypothetical protein KKI02_01590, partial [Planctomycetes bacterium]|nr:hypothetical protein [Planctomycetota bacterium]
MALLSATRRRPRKRRWRWIRLAVWTVALLWFAHYAHVRVTTPPAAVSKRQHELADGGSREDELLELIRELPIAPPATRPATSGWWGAWTSSVLGAGLL